MASPRDVEKASRADTAPLVPEDAKTDANANDAQPPKRLFVFTVLLASFTICFLIGTLSPSACWSRASAVSVLTTKSKTDIGVHRYDEGVHVPAVHAVQSRDLDADVIPFATSTSSAPAPSRTVLKCFEVDQPVLLPGGAAESDGSGMLGGSGGGYEESKEGGCTLLLMRRDFAWSYEDPFIGNYTPPNCKFNRVVLNFTSVSHGRQYDRLAIMYIGDTEVWRTSTAQPVTPPGIVWTYMKDMTQYLYFWKQPQKIIFDLGNLVNDKYTGIFNTTLTAHFFWSDVPTDTAPASDLIIPISARQSAKNAISQFTLPRDNASNSVTFPTNARRAVFSVSANGQALEEFWWSNVLQSDIYTFNATAGQLTGNSPFREVQVLIDGQLAGVSWPFPVIFTGGVSPGLHRPIVSVEAFDLREKEIDITPFLPLLSDGKEHTFSIRVAGLDDSLSPLNAKLTERVDENWYVTGKIFVWLADSSAATTGMPPTLSLSPPIINLTHKIGTNADGMNSTLTYTVSVKRTLSIAGTINTSGTTSTTTWSQDLSYSNTGILTEFGYNAINDLVTTGIDESKGAGAFKVSYSYPLLANSTYNVTPQGNLSIWAHVKQGKSFSVSGASVYPDGLEAFGGSSRFSGSSLVTTKEGVAAFWQSGDGYNASGWGTAEQVFRFGGVSKGGALGDVADVELYWRNVSAVNGSVVWDFKRGWKEGGRVQVEGGDGRADLSKEEEFVAVEGAGVGVGALRAFVGRGGLES
ncbi:peptide N-acetyl-beta-D-glucosaminyl asparaginase amidase A-domain-containing protein [Podospora aff. communis PSN243]|uniref:Peptide N-acetyl-beta-D-glucosaminyl asparaginase amidase A-domain-containing protein n=1 Tax=Podospora aff. communis PSN243 TaxID=3040156 RepID=A0AAV9GU59_9PEZI|nr:peptide N-acetyl-beta-D-glucosaminyl asparaginase amidase A-domain-containing protein [Podospora aff. communis PSN243]